MAVMRQPTPYIVGLTGGIGSGKSSVAEYLSGKGAGLIDTDEIAHRLSDAGQAGALAVCKHFGAEYLLENGALDRAKLRQRIFAEPAAKRQLEAIMHPLIGEAVARLLQAAHGVPYVILAVPLLIETGNYLKLVDRVLVVDCPVALQISRVMARSKLTEAEVRAIIAQQVDREERLRHADDVLVNDEGLDKLQLNAEQLHWKYMQLSESKNFSSKGL